MFRRFDHRGGHCILLIGVAAALFLCRLGTPGLWDIDEGNNAECSREMLDSGDWVVPTFNYQLRVDKPALLYWLQIGAYRLFGVGAFAARLPSVVAAVVTVLLTYELGRRMFGPAAGLLAGVILAASVMFCASAHFANPDALLNTFTALTLLIFWLGIAPSPRPGSATAGQTSPLSSPHGRSRNWFVPAGVSAALAVLAKGPVGLVLPGAVMVLFLLWCRRWRLLLDRRFLWGALAFVLIALPWYAWVAAETKASFLRGFILTHNVGRFLSPMENHQGPVYYYLVVLLVGYAPWSPFIGLTSWAALKQAWNLPGADAADPAAERRALACRLLLCWVGVYLAFFSLSGTKLPNYILPLYVPLALLTADVLDRWRRGDLVLPGWVMHVGLACLVVVGVVTAFGLLVTGGAIEAPFIRGRYLPGLAAWAGLGLIPVLAAVAGWWCVRRQGRTAFVAAVAVGAVLFVGGLAAEGGTAWDAQRAPRTLALAIVTDQAEPEIRVGCYEYFQPSLVFYCRREVQQLADERAALTFLRYPLPVYLLLPASTWDVLQTRVRGPHRLLARHRDVYRGWDVVVVTNAPAASGPSTPTE